MKAADLPAGASAFCVHRVPSVRQSGHTQMCAERLIEDDDGMLRCRKHGYDFNDHRTSVLDCSIKP